MSDRLTVSCYKGLAPISVPKNWVEGFDYKHGFAHENNKAQIYFKSVNRGFEVWVTYHRGEPTGHYRELTQDEIQNIQWGEIEAPWEPYQVAALFGHGPVLEIE